MKFVVSIVLLFAGISANASSGQQYREDIRDLQTALNLSYQGFVDGSICGSEDFNQFTLLSTATGDVYALSMNSFSSSVEPDGDADTANVVVVADCSKKTLRF